MKPRKIPRWVEQEVRRILPAVVLDYEAQEVDSRVVVEAALLRAYRRGMRDERKAVKPRIDWKKVWAAHYATLPTKIWRLGETLKATQRKEIQRLVEAQLRRKARRKP